MALKWVIIKRRNKQHRGSRTPTFQTLIYGLSSPMTLTASGTLPHVVKPVADFDTSCAFSCRPTVTTSNYRIIGNIGNTSHLSLITWQARLQKALQDNVGLCKPHWIVLSSPNEQASAKPLLPLLLLTVQPFRT
jgi:hypothetical protein